MGVLILASVKRCQFVPSIFFQCSCRAATFIAEQRLKGLFIMEVPRSWSLAACRDQQTGPQPHGKLQSLEEEKAALQILTSAESLHQC